MTKPERKKQNTPLPESENFSSDTGFPNIYGRFGEGTDEAKLPQLSIIPGLIATVLWVALLLWLAMLPGGLLHQSAKPVLPNVNSASRHE